MCKAVLFVLPTFLRHPSSDSKHAYISILIFCATCLPTANGISAIGWNERLHYSHVFHESAAQFFFLGAMPIHAEEDLTRYPNYCGILRKMTIKDKDPAGTHQ